MAFYMHNFPLYWLAWWLNITFFRQGIHFCREINPLLMINPVLAVFRKKSSKAMKNGILHPLYWLAGWLNVCFESRKKSSAL